MWLGKLEGLIGGFLLKLYQFSHMLTLSHHIYFMKPPVFSFTGPGNICLSFFAVCKEEEFQKYWWLWIHGVPKLCFMGPEFPIHIGSVVFSFCTELVLQKLILRFVFAYSMLLNFWLELWNMINGRCDLKSDNRNLVIIS